MTFSSRRTLARSRLLALVLSAMLLAACGADARQIQPEVESMATFVPAPQPESQPATPTLPATATAPPAPAHVHPTTTATSLADPPTPVMASATATPAATATVAPTSTTTTPSEAIDERPLVIVLDPGHDRSSPGALGIEYQVVLRTAFIVREALEAAGYEVHLTREDNDFVFREHPELLPPNAGEMHPGYGAAYAHASRALEYNPDLVLLLHYNGHPNPNVRGIEIYYCEMGGPQNLVLAGIVMDELVLALESIGYDTPSTRIAEDLAVARGNRHFPSLGNVYDPPQVWVENRYAGIPVVLTEPLYMTNPIERPFLDNEETHQAIADAYVRAINTYFGR